MSAPAGETCANCQYWQRQTPGWGNCCRYAPHPAVPPAERLSQVPPSLWPATEADDWCGEYEKQVPPQATLLPVGDG